MDTILFRLSEFQNLKANTQYKKKYPNQIIPPDYFLYETFQLNYKKFMVEGELAAQEICSWISPYLNTDTPSLLDWGCGVGRIIRHIPYYLPNATLYACDINESMIEWNKSNYTSIAFSTIQYEPPFAYPASFFDVIIGMSILTHIEDALQKKWLATIHRVLKKDGLVIFTTHGKYYEKKLTHSEKEKLLTIGIYTQQYHKKGHRLQSTYHTIEHFTEMIASYFTILEVFPGHNYPNKIGGQDVWILQKK